MRGMILKGEYKEKEEYIYKYIRDNDIPQYNVVRFEEDLKIADAREIKKILGSASFSGKKRIIIISANPTQEAQSALLKTIEELDEKTDFIFSGEAELIPTIISRCQVVVISSFSPTTSSEMTSIERIINHKNAAELFSGIESFFSEKKEDPYKELLLVARQALKNSIQEGDFLKAAVCHRLLKALNLHYPLVISNNLNSKISIEKVVLSLTT